MLRIVVYIHVIRIDRLILTQGPNLLPPLTETTVMNTNRSGGKLAGEELRRNNTKTLRAAAFF